LFNIYSTKNFAFYSILKYFRRESDELRAKGVVMTRKEVIEILLKEQPFKSNEEEMTEIELARELMSIFDEADNSMTLDEVKETVSAAVKAAFACEQIKRLS
jgi:hypothetical protein